MPSAEEVAAAVWRYNIAQLEGIGPAPASAWLQHTAVMGSRAANALSSDADKNGVDRLGDLWEQADRHHAELLAAILGQEPGKVDPAALAAAIPADIAEQVVEALGKRLTPPAA